MAIDSSGSFAPGAALPGYDAVIVGAGVSGLLAAHTLLNQKPGARVLLIDAGLPLERRRRDASSGAGGYGGAGLFLGGRLYFGATTLPVTPPVTMPPELGAVLGGDEFVRRANEVDGLFHTLGARADWQAGPPEPLARAIDQAAEAGLDYITSYPSRRLSQEDKYIALGALRERLLSGGAGFLFQALVTDAERDEAGFVLTVRPATEAADAADAVIPDRIRAKTLLLAPGRYGAEWLRQIAQHLGARVVASPSTFGVRIEVLARAYDPLTDVNPDPRLQRMAQGDALIKTYATCPGGRVTPVSRYGTLVASGTPVLQPELRGPTTTVAILAQPGVEGAAGAWAGGEEGARLLNARAAGRLIVQRLGDVRARQATTTPALEGNSVHPSDTSAVPGSLHDAYSETYWSAFEDFLTRLDQLAPGVSADDTLVYGPAEERFWGFPTDDRLQTTTAGLFVAGDGAGQSQGIIQASVAGMLAGEGMARALEDAPAGE